MGAGRMGGVKTSGMTGGVLSYPSGHLRCVGLAGCPPSSTSTPCVQALAWRGPQRGRCTD